MASQRNFDRASKPDFFVLKTEPNWALDFPKLINFYYFPFTYIKNIFVLYGYTVVLLPRTLYFKDFIILKKDWYNTVLAALIFWCIMWVFAVVQIWVTIVSWKIRKELQFAIIQTDSTYASLFLAHPLILIPYKILCIAPSEFNSILGICKDEGI